MGLLNSSGVIHYTLTHFNDSSSSEIFQSDINSLLSFINISIRLPVNSSIRNSIFKVQGENITYWNQWDLQTTQSEGNCNTHNAVVSNGSTYFCINLGRVGDDCFKYGADVTSATTCGSDDSFSTNCNGLYGGAWNGTHFALLCDTGDGNTLADSIVFYNRDWTDNYTLILEHEMGLHSDNGGFGWNISHFFIQDNSNDKIGIYTTAGVNIKNISVASEMDIPGWIVVENITTPNTYYVWVRDDGATVFKYTTEGTYTGDSRSFNTNGYSEPDHCTTTLNQIWICGDELDNTFYNWYVYTNNSGYPFNVSIKLNNTLIFNASNKFNSTNFTKDISSELQNCVNEYNNKDSQGYLNCLLNITSDKSGKITLSSLSVNYTYNLSSKLETTNFWNKTSNFTPNMVINISQKYKFSSFISTELNITGFFINSSQNECWIDGSSKTVTTNSFGKYCELTTPEYLTSNGGIWNNHTLFDGSIGHGIPVNSTNSSQILNNSRERIRYFNLSSFYPNGSIANDSLGDIIYNITVQINLTDTDLPNRTQGYLQGVRWFNGSDFIEVNISNRCTVTNNIYEDNYTYTLNAGLNFSGCYNDTNNNDIWDYFKVLVPKLSNQEFYVFGQEDTKFPNITITQPSGTFSSSSVTVNLNVIDDIGLSDCFYNITNDIETITEVPKTTFTCGNYSSNHTISTNDDYFINVFANDTSGNINITRGSFSISISSGGTTTVSGGGGGGSDPIQIPKKDCKIFLTPEHFDFTTDNTVQQLTVENLEESSSYSPIYNISTSSLQLRGVLNQIIPPKESQEVVLVYSDFVNTTLETKLIVSSNVCKDKFVTVNLYPKGESPPNRRIEDFLNEKLGIVSLFNKSFIIRNFHVMGLFSALTFVSMLFFMRTIRFLIKVPLFIIIVSTLTIMTDISLNFIK